KGLDKTGVFEQFPSRGLFRIGTCYRPFDRLSPKARRISIAREAPGLARRAKELDPGSIVIVKQTVYGPVRHALETAGLGDRVLNTEPLPFPSHGNQRRYRLRLRRLIRNMNQVSRSADYMLDQFDVITFDCYGTLIDWETGMRRAFRKAMTETRAEPGLAARSFKLYEMEERRI